MEMDSKNIQEGEPKDFSYYLFSSWEREKCILKDQKLESENDTISE